MKLSQYKNWLNWSDFNWVSTVISQEPITPESANYFGFGFTAGFGITAEECNW